MPARYLMTWEPGPRRWRKLYRGKMFIVSCRQLSAPETKDGSYQAANSWWQVRRTEIDGQQQPNPHTEYLADLSRRQDWARRQDEQAVASFIGWNISRIRGGGEPCSFGRQWSSYDDEVKSRLDQDGHPSSELLDSINPINDVWIDRVTRDNPEPVPDEKTVGGLVKAWLSLKRAKVESGDISAKGYDNTVDCLNHFRDWVGAEAAATVIDAHRWQGYWLHLSGRVKDKVWSRDYTSKVFRTARNFVEWLGNMDIIPPLKNLHDREYRFGTTTQAVPTMTVEEVRRLVENATGQLRLHILMMANCGMTQQDIADLRQDEVDWVRGRIVRKRSKTRDSKNVPVVNFKLWPHTWELLQVHRTGNGELALLTLSGRPWVDANLVDGKLVSTDNIASNYTHLKRKLKFKKPLKLLRKTSASLLDCHPEFGRYVPNFLGHSPRGISAKHYTDPSREQMDNAVAWLGQQYGFLSEWHEDSANAFK